MTSKLTASSLPTGVDFLKPDDLAALKRFAECCEDFDAGGHDLTRDSVRRLTEIGVIRHVGGGRHQTTSFGDFCLVGRDDETTTPLMTLDERNARSEKRHHDVLRQLTTASLETHSTAHDGLAAELPELADHSGGPAFADERSQVFAADRERFVDDYCRRHRIPATVLPKFVWQAPRAQIEHDGWKAGRASLLEHAMTLAIAGEAAAADAYARGNMSPDCHEVSVDSFCAGVSFACKMLPTIIALQNKKDENDGRRES